MQKYGFDDARPVLERASARETAARVALGAVARAFLEQALGVSVLSHVVAHRRGRRAVRDGAGAGRPGRGGRRRWCAASTRRRATAMVAEIDAARKDGDTLGGIVEVVAHGLPPGLGSHVHGDRRLDARLAGGADGHPGDQGRRGRRRVRRWPAAAAPRRTTRSRAGRTGCAGAPGAPAAPRAG